MFYTVYKITNRLNNKFYVGMHRTENLDDGYMGSGKLIKLAIAKHGIENFTKEILHVFDNENDMRNKEKELVVLNETSYNLCEGGGGGFDYINKNPDTKWWWVKRDSEQFAVAKSKLSEKTKLNHQLGKLKPPPSWVGKKHSEETKQKISGLTKNNVYINDGVKNKRIKDYLLDEYLEIGYSVGRI